MSDGVLDLSLSSYDVTAQRSSRSHDQVSSDSGRASSDSTSSEVHDDIKPRYRTSPPRMMGSPSSGAPVPLSGAVLPSSDISSSDNTHHLGLRPSPVAFPPSVGRLRNIPPSLPISLTQQHPHTTTSGIRSSTSPPRVGMPGPQSNPNSPEASSSLQEEDMKPTSLSMTTSGSFTDRGNDPRVAPIRPFKMYPVDAFNVYNSQLMPGSGSGLSTSVGIQSLYDSGSPSSFASFPLTPLTSHLLQRKRRAELRENANSLSCPVKSDAGSPPATAVGSSSSPTNSGMTSVTTSVPMTMSEISFMDQENDADAEKKAKLNPDERKDDAYWDRRRKNNEAAKRSRDARRQKEEEIAMRAAFLEQENLKLRAQVAILKNETAKLHYMLYNRI